MACKRSAVRARLAPPNYKMKFSIILIVLGLAYRLGIGVDQSFTKSLKWYKESASKGHSGAQYNLNLLFEEGLATRQDISDAIKWYRCGR